AFLMSSSSDECTCASGAISSSICRSLRVKETDNLNGGRGGGGSTCDDPEAPGDPKVPDGLTGGGGGVHSSDDEDIRNAHIPKVKLRQDRWKPLEEDRPATPEPAWHNVSKPLPLGGPPGQVTIESDFFFNKDFEYLRYGSKGSRPALSISKMKATYYPDAGLEQMVPDQIHTSEGDRRAVRTHIRILNVVKIKVFSMYGYNYMKKIVLRRANLNETLLTRLQISVPKHLVIKQRVKDFQLRIESYQTQLNLTKPRWDATGFEYKHDYTIDEALDYRVKGFKVNRMNPGWNTRFWTRKDVDRSKEFMFVIQKRLKTRWIFCNLESFVGGRVKDEDYRLLKRTE
nr:hypothetical protein [Tanacetum cinerariifolium]